MLGRDFRGSLQEVLGIVEWAECKRSREKGNVSTRLFPQEDGKWLLAIMEA